MHMRVAGQRRRDKGQAVFGSETLQRSADRSIGGNAARDAFVASSISGEATMVEAWDGWCNYGIAENKAIKFVVPKEGSLINSDTLCIPKGAPRPDNAHKFINYLLDAEAGAGISKTILYPTPNAAAKALMPDDYKNNPVIFPPTEIMAKCEYGAFEGAEKASEYEEVITRVRAA